MQNTNIMKIKNYATANIVVVFLIALVILMAILIPTSFFSANNLINIITQISAYGIVAYAMTFAIIAGEFDLSVGSTFGMATILFIDVSSKFGIPMGMLAAVGFGCLIGSLNGFLVAKVKNNAFIVTLATMTSVKGLALQYTGGTPINFNNDFIYNLGNGSFCGIPYIVIIMLSVLVVAQMILSKTKFGRNLYATGGNFHVAKIAGIKVEFYKFIIFVILGTMAGFAGILFASRVNAGSALYGGDLALYCVAATVIGGTRLSGGSGNAIKTLLGLLVLGILFNSLTLMQVEALYQDIIKGVVVILVVSLDTIQNKKKMQ